MVRIRYDLPADFFSKGFTTETDLFQKKDLADRLSKLYGSLTHGTVAILDGRWGSGKSVFAQQWKTHLENTGIPCIYFDAFASDYIEDPFTVVASSLVKAAKMAQSRDDVVYNQFLGAVVKTIRAIAVPSPKLVVKAATFGLIGKDEIDGFGDASAEIVSDFGEMTESGIATWLEKQTENHEKFMALRKALETLPSVLYKDLQIRLNIESAEPVKNQSLVVMIDELDRCRPDFALSILEVLKHFFGTSSIHFVLITNLNHLTSSVNNRYGTGESSIEYIQKFYDFIIPFEGRKASLSETNASLHTRRLLEQLFTGMRNQEGYDLAEVISQMVAAYNLSLRQAERIVTNIVLCNIDYSSTNFRPAILVALLVLIKSEQPALFYSIKGDRYNNIDLQEFIDKGTWAGNIPIERLKKIILYHSDPNIDENDVSFEGYAFPMFGFHFRSRMEVLPYLANSVVDKYT